MFIIGVAQTRSPSGFGDFNWCKFAPISLFFVASLLQFRLKNDRFCSKLAPISGLFLGRFLEQVCYKKPVFTPDSMKP
jgi:hypothetical protein